MRKKLTYSRAQKALTALLALPANGFEMEIVEQSAPFIGLTEALRGAENAAKFPLNRTSAAVIVAEGNSAQESVRMMSREAGTKGADMGTRFSNVILHLAALDGKLATRAVTVVFDEAEAMKGADLIKLLRTASYVANRNDLDVRLVFVIGKVPKYDFKKRGYFEADYPAMWSDAGLRALYSPHARVWQYTQKSLTERKPAKAWCDESQTESQATPLFAKEA